MTAAARIRPATGRIRNIHLLNIFNIGQGIPA